MLSAWWHWLALAAVPPLIVLLYFLKLKRQPVEVPSTYLWHKSIEDLHVNSIWQRLRQSLLLFLQLLLLLLAILALLRPTWNSSRMPGDRFIFLIDASASMAATDVEPTRLEEAKRRALALVDQMAPDAVGMVISFSDSARVEQQFTASHKLLRRAIEGIRQTNRVTNMKEALQAAAGLANPGRSAFTPDDQVLPPGATPDVAVAEALPAMLKIFTDGGMERVENFALGNLDPEYIQMGAVAYEKPDEPDPAKRGPATAWADNVGITAFTSRRKEGTPLEVEAFARLENFGPQEAEVDLELFLGGELVDARRVSVPPAESAGVPFDLGEVQSGVLELRAKTGDVLKVDDRAWATINPPQRARVLLVTPGNEPLELALGTDSALLLADVTTEPPEFLESKDYQTQAAAGAYGLVIYDRCAPQQPPLANTLYVGTLPPGDLWSAEAKVDVPLVIDTDRSHPLMQLIDLGNVIFLEGTPLKPPQGSTELIDTDRGPLMAIGPRGAYEDAVLGLEIASTDQIKTNWAIRASFPVFVLNFLKYLGGTRDPLGSGHLRPGEMVALESTTPTDTMVVRTPSGRSVTVRRGNLNKFDFAETGEVGVYDVVEAGQVTQRVAVNLFHPPESDIKPKDLQIGHTEVAGKNVAEPAKREVWKVLLLVGLAVLLFEWYIYNRRVYL
jgi:hypothetical protein